MAATGHGGWSSEADLGTVVKASGAGVEQGYQTLGVAGPEAGGGGQGVLHRQAPCPVQSSTSPSLQTVLGCPESLMLRAWTVSVSQGPMKSTARPGWEMVQAQNVVFQVGAGQSGLGLENPK